jgi:hypothetical protein
MESAWQGHRLGGGGSTAAIESQKAAARRCRTPYGITASGSNFSPLDLCEVSPGETEWDANVGARLLYKMIGFALLTQ